MYGRNVSLQFLKYVREEITFANLDELIIQMKLDEQHARDYFSHKNLLNKQ